MIKNQPVIPLFFPPGPDFQKITENSTFPILQVRFVNSKSDAMLMPHVGQGVYTNDVFSGAFKIFQIIGMIDNTGMIGVFIIDPGMKYVGSRHGHE
jgi:hypothetical protein